MNAWSSAIGRVRIRLARAGLSKTEVLSPLGLGNGHLLGESLHEECGYLWLHGIVARPERVRFGVGECNHPQKPV